MSTGKSGSVRYGSDVEPGSGMFGRGLSSGSEVSLSVGRIRGPHHGRRVTVTDVWCGTNEESMSTSSGGDETRSRCSFIGCKGLTDPDRDDLGFCYV